MGSCVSVLKRGIYGGVSLKKLDYGFVKLVSARHFST